MSDLECASASQVGSTSMIWGGSFALLCSLLYLAVQIRRITLIRVIFLPASLIAGVLGLVLVQTVKALGSDDYPDDPCVNSFAIFSADFTAGWSSLPGILINVVFACIFLGRNVPTVSEAWKMGGPQLMYGQIRAWGSWFWCVGITVCLLTPVWGVNPLFGCLFSVGFEGGHGTAGGLRDLLGEDLYGMAVTSATIGIVLGCLGGTLLVNWGVSRGHLHWQKADLTASLILAEAKDPHHTGEVNNTSNQYLGNSLAPPHNSDHNNVGNRRNSRSWNPDEPEPENDDEYALHTSFRQVEPLPEAYGDRHAIHKGITTPKTSFKNKLKQFPRDMYDIDARPSAGYQTIRSEAIDALALQVVHVGLAVFIGYAIVRLLALIDHISPEMQDLGLFSNFPMFPMCMIGGVLIEIFYKQTGLKNPIDGVQMNMISGCAIEFLCASAIATVNLTMNSAEAISFVLVLLVGIIWQLGMFFFVAKRVLPNFWFERAIVEFGQSFGTTSIGLLLLRMTDPTRSTDAWESFSYKQMMHEPFMGGGIWTTFAVMFLSTLANGSWIVLGISAAMVLLWTILYFVYFKGSYAKNALITMDNPVDDGSPVLLQANKASSMSSSRSNTSSSSDDQSVQIALAEVSSESNSRIEV